jgi:hypothetical protein
MITVPAVDCLASDARTSPIRDDFPASASAMLGTVDPRDRLRSVGKRMTDPVEPFAQRVAERAIEILVNALDVNAREGRVDLNAVLDHVDVNEVLRKVDVNALLEKVDLNGLLDRVDLAPLLDRVDVNALLDRVDVNPLLDRVDVNPLLDRVDLDPLLDRVDVNALLDRIDVNHLVGRIDMDTLVEQTDLGALIARSSGGVATEALDAARSQAVGLDQFIDRWVRRLLRRKHPGPAAPAALLDARAQS